MSGSARDVGLGEIVALEEEGLAGGPRERVGEHIAKVECSRVPAFTEPAEGLAGEFGLPQA